MKKLIFIFMMMLTSNFFGQNADWTGTKTFKPTLKFVGLPVNNANTKFMTLDANGKPCTSDVPVSEPQVKSDWNATGGLSEILNKPVITSRPYKVYTARLVQFDTFNPDPYILENTLGGNITWTRIGVGSYIGTLTGAFPRYKTIGFTNPIETNVTSSLRWISSDTIKYEMTLDNGTSIANTDNFENVIEIRVYNAPE